ncbi:MAG: MFS transporter [Dehalococcoidia bacterium]|nr:MFS transporter [Dehalococcoidia bacterium]
MDTLPKIEDHKTAVLLVTSIAAFLTPFMSASINIALPTMGMEFATDAITLSWIATSFILSAAVFLIPLGRIADISGRKKVFIWGGVVFGGASVICALAWSAPVLIAARVLQGVGGAMLFGTSAAIISSVYPPGERGRAMGINIAITYLGLSLGPFLGGIMTQYMGWRSIFWLNTLLCTLLVVVTIWKLKPEWAEARGERFDLFGSVIYGAGLVALMYGLSELPSTHGFVSLGSGLVILLIFLKWETLNISPILDITLFAHNQVFAFSNLAAFINYSATFAVGFLLSLYLQYIKGLTPADAGIVLVAMPVVQAVFSPLTGRLSDRIEPRLLASAGMALTAAGLLLLMFIGADTATWYIIFCLIMLGAGFALFSSPNINAVMSSVDKKSLGVASATLATMRLTGQMFSLGIAMLLISLFMGRVQVTPEVYPQYVQSLQTAFAIFTALCIGGIFASMARGKTH